ncbi:MAG: hypothetical protein QE263_09810 [Vampirovibrionales bacterium]|nr:hypothetical protein [Vampirovibrionales bacterium]
MTTIPTYSITANVGRALEHAPLKSMLRGQLTLSLALASGLFVANSVIQAPKGEKQKTLLQNGLAALGTVLAAMWGANRYLAPHANHAGALAAYTMEHLGALLPAEAAAASKGWHQLHDILEKKASEWPAHLKTLVQETLGLSDKTMGNHELEHLLEAVDDPKAIQALLEKVGINLKEGFGATINKALQASANHPGGLTAKAFQAFKNDTLQHLLLANGAKPIAPEVLEKLTHTAPSLGALQTIRNHLGEWAGKGASTLKQAKERVVDWMNVITQGPGNATSEHMREELVDLAKMGGVPILGGIAGGLLGDLITKDNWVSKLKDKVNEGVFQWGANITLCNVGGAAFLWVAEQSAWLQRQNKMLSQMLPLVSGIAIVGIAGGSAIANFLSENFIHPLIYGGPAQVGKTLKERWSNGGVSGLFKDLYRHRKFEPLDAGMHVDDFASAAVVSGFGIVEPFLALLYTLSGIRAGIGYRNGEKDDAPMPPRVNVNETAQSWRRLKWDQSARQTSRFTQFSRQAV